mgnify:CR=1 FL=1
MRPFTRHEGLVMPLDRSNVDTDQIIPAQFLKLVGRTGFGRYLFYEWRYLGDGQTPNPEFVLNRPEYAGASILLARENFGSGSSREHAVWALMDYGFRVVIAPSFADIFYNNSFKNGLLPVTLSPEQVDLLFARAAGGRPLRLVVDLEACRVTGDGGLDTPFDIDPARRRRLLEGLDEIALTLRHEDLIAAYERRRAETMPWL